MTNFDGPIVALLTPFHASGEIDWQAFKAYLSALHSWGVRAVIANGTTGEFPSLTLTERQKVAEFARGHYPGTIINNVSATCVKDVKKLIAGTQGCGDAVLLLPPYYYAACRNDGLYRFFADALMGVSVPIFLYNFPQHTGNRLDADLLALLVDQGVTVTGIKDSSGDLDNAMVYRLRFSALKIFFASDTQALSALQRGLSGLVTGGANPLPECLIAMQAFFQASGAKAHAMQRCLDIWNAFRETSGRFEIPLVKAAMGARVEGFPFYVRAPFTPIPDNELKRVRKVIVDCINEYNAVVAAA
jgi:dihydrodipicolinate synthase/N-acetylneuraminate lyase